MAQGARPQNTAGQTRRNDEEGQHAARAAKQLMESGLSKHSSRLKRMEQTLAFSSSTTPSSFA
jgi:hypothetical protein